jgi:hypothetical protein
MRRSAAFAPMSFAITVQRRPHFVRYEVKGPASLKNYSDLIDEAARQTATDRDRRAMVDLRGVLGRLHFTDQFFIGELVVRKLQHLDRLATVVPDDPATYTSEKVAARHGFQLRGFVSEEEAQAWLSEEPGA